MTFFERSTGALMTIDLAANVREAMAVSRLLRAVDSVRRDGGLQLGLGDRAVRALSGAEIDRLEHSGNVADDWGRLRVAEGFDPRQVRGCSFRGDVILGSFLGQAALSGVELPTGLFDSVLA